MSESHDIVSAVLDDGTNILVEVTHNEGEAADVSAMDSFDFRQLAGAISGIAETARTAIDKVAPDVAVVEFELGVSIESGKLAALLVAGNGKANFKVSLTWNKPT